LKCRRLWHTRLCVCVCGGGGMRGGKGWGGRGEKEGVHFSLKGKTAHRLTGGTTR